MNLFFYYFCYSRLFLILYEGICNIYQDFYSYKMKYLKNQKSKLTTLNLLISQSITIWQTIHNRLLRILHRFLNNPLILIFRLSKLSIHLLNLILLILQFLLHLFFSFNHFIQHQLFLMSLLKYSLILIQLILCLFQFL